MNIKKFNESQEDDDFEGQVKVKVQVKDLISFLQRLDPEANVYLDKDGWMVYGDVDPSDGVAVIENSGLFDVFDGSLFINN